MYFLNCFVLQGLIFHVSSWAMKLLQCTLKLCMVCCWFERQEPLFHLCHLEVTHAKDHLWSHSVLFQVCPSHCQAQSITTLPSLCYQQEVKEITLCLKKHNRRLKNRIATGLVFMKQCAVLAVFYGFTFLSLPQLHVAWSVLLILHCA